MYCVIVLFSVEYLSKWLANNHIQFYLCWCVYIHIQRPNFSAVMLPYSKKAEDFYVHQGVMVVCVFMSVLRWTGNLSEVYAAARPMTSGIGSSPQWPYTG